MAVEVGIPIYKARDTLPQALDSLVAQTKKNFIVCLSIDGDNENYDDIIKTYIERGLKIRVISSKENGGPGAARQRILDSTICDYITFLDADDMFMPRAIEILYTEAKTSNYDIVRGAIIREHSGGKDELMLASDNVVTWFHAKIYKMDYIKKYNLHFYEGLRVDEDSYFNAVAWNATDNKGLTNEPLYIWRDNKNSITRRDKSPQYFKNTCYGYIHGQVEAMKYLKQIKSDVPDLLLTNTFLNLYYYYMTAKFYKFNDELTQIEKSIMTLRDISWAQNWYNSKQTWVDVLNNVKIGNIYDNDIIVFYKENFFLWATRLIKAPAAES